MADYLGRIAIPKIFPTGVFPIVPDFGHGQEIAPSVAIHTFGSGHAKIEQRFLLGMGARRFRIVRRRLPIEQRDALAQFWEGLRGPYATFYYDAPSLDQLSTTRYVVRFENAPLGWQMLEAAAAQAGVTLVEVPTANPTYPLSQTLRRFPNSLLEANLLSQVQELIPLVRIQPLEPDYPAILLSDRRCTVGQVNGGLYLPRLLRADGIAQALGNAADQASFTFGNADRAMLNLANDVDLFRATIDYSLFHVGTGIKLDLWRGSITDWSADGGPEFRVQAADGIYELNLPYPTRTAGRSCQKVFGLASACPFSSKGSMDYAHFPTASPTWCDKGYDTPNGCLAHGMKRYHGGLPIDPEGVTVKDNSTGVWGFRRASLTSVSIQSETIRDQVIPEVYTDTKLVINAKIASGRDESDFYEALIVVCEGPITFGSEHKLDGQYHHGYPESFGLRQLPGGDPAGELDYFSLDWVGDARSGDWRRAYSGNSTFKDNFAAGTAALVIRRKDEKGLQLSRPDEHSAQAVIVQGLRGWIWTSAGNRYEAVVTNPVWIAVNMILRARGMRHASAGRCEELFDVDAAVAAAAICDLPVTPYVPRTMRVWVEDEPGRYDEQGNWVEAVGHYEEQAVTAETQFKFRGVIQEQKPLRDWVQEVLMNCLGDYTFAFGKFKPIVRINSSVTEAFTVGNILFQSLKLAPRKPAYNHLTGNFADEEADFAGNAVTVYDIGHAQLIGGAATPYFLKGQVNLAGSSSKSQTGRLVNVRLCEELGGTTAEQWKKARRVSFRTTVLALNAEPGTVCSLNHPDMPDGHGEFRITSWRLNPDWSIDIEGVTTTDSMYDYAQGPKPADVAASPFPRTMRDLLPRPPFGLLPYQEKPLETDSIEDPTMWTFGLAPIHEIAADGIGLISLAVTTKLPVNLFAPQRPPKVADVGDYDAAGGAVKGGRTYYAAVCAKSADGQYSGASEGITRIKVPSGSDQNVLKVPVIAWPDGAPGGWSLFAGENRDRLSWQRNGTGTPNEIQVAGPLLAGAWGLPDGEFDRLRLKVKRVYHSGIIGQQVSDVSATGIKIGGTWTADQLKGRIVSVVARWRNFTEMPALNYRVKSNQDDEQGAHWLTFEDGQNPLADGLKANDVIIIRYRPTIVDETHVGDPNMRNWMYPDGATPGEEAGRLIRFIAGTGRGMVRRVIGNTADTWEVDRAWDVTPDATSVFIVEESKWQAAAESTPIDNVQPLETATFRVPVENLAHLTVLVQAVTIDGGGHEAPETDCPAREIYLWGVAGAYVRDFYLAILLVEAPITEGEDIVANRGRIRLDDYTEVELNEVAITAKQAPSTGAFVADILTSQDGATWTSIFPGGEANKAVLPQNHPTAEITTFLTGKLLQNDLIRVDCMSNGGAVGVQLEIKGKVVTTS